MKATILVTGSNGQLGSELKKISEKNDTYNFIFTDYKELDITKSEEVNTFFEKNNINYVFNCAAYTAVDKAESEEEKAYLINATGVKHLAEASHKFNAKLISISTDYVYSGSNFTPYKEEEQTAPQSAYGRTKLAGEQEALKYNNSIIIRTSWLYSEFGNNFVKTMIRLGTERDKLSVVFDQIGTPTYAGDLAKAMMDIVDYSETKQFIAGIYNYSNEGVCSWYDFAKCIFELKNIDCKLSPIETKDFPTPASRPFFSVMNKAKIKNTFNIEIPHWHDSLKLLLTQ